MIAESKISKRSVKDQQNNYILFIHLTTNVYVLQHVVGRHIKVKIPNYNYRLKYKCSEYTINMRRRQNTC